MKLTPFGRNILVKPIEKKQVLVGDTNKLCEYGEVVAIGDEVTKIKVGEIIGFMIFGVNRLDVEGEQCHLIPESDEFILGIISGI